MFVLLNPESGGGRALERWASIESEVLHRIGPFRLEIAAGSAVIRNSIAQPRHPICSWRKGSGLPDATDS